MDFGQTIRQWRKEKRITLVELSSKSGVPIATISRIETGKMRGTVDSHQRLAEGLGVKLTDLYRAVEAEKFRTDLRRRSDRSDIFVYNARTTSEILTPQVLQKKFMPVLFQIAPGGKTALEETKPGTEKFFYLFDGKLEVTVGDKVFELNRGDTLYFDASAPHVIKNMGKTPARCFCVVAPPTL